MMSLYPYRTHCLFLYGRKNCIFVGSWIVCETETVSKAKPLVANRHILRYYIKDVYVKYVKYVKYVLLYVSHLNWNQTRFIIITCVCVCCVVEDDQLHRGTDKTGATSHYCSFSLF